mgnify:CR=1 FL=1
MSISDGEVDTSKPGTYEITYSVSPVSDARMYWHEKYTVNVTEKPAESMGMKVVADDNIIHATVTDENGNDTEVFKGCDYNLNAGVNGPEQKRARCRGRHHGKKKRQDNRKQ